MCGACGTYDELLETVEREKPDVVVTDIRMPPTGTDEGIRAALALRDSHPKTGVVVLSQYVDPAYALALLERGSEGRAYLLKERVSDAAQIVHAIEEVAPRRQRHRPARRRSAGRQAHRPHARPRSNASRRANAKCSSRWRRAATTPASPRRCSSRERAVEKHINSLFSKLGLSEEPDVHRRVKAVLLFLSEQGGEHPRPSSRAATLAAAG